MNDQAVKLLRELVDAIEHETGNAPVAEARTFLTNLDSQKKIVVRDDVQKSFTHTSPRPSGKRPPANPLKNSSLVLVNSKDPDNQVIISQLDLSLTEEQTISLDQWLRSNGVLTFDLELTIVDDINEISGGNDE